MVILENRLYIGDEISVAEFGHGKIVAFLKPEGYDYPVVIIENSEGKRLAKTVDALADIEIISTTPHQQILFPGETLTDECYGVGVIKDVAAMDTDTIITILYEAHFCVYRNSINAKNLIESKKIIPRY